MISLTWFNHLFNLIQRLITWRENLKSNQIIQLKHVSRPFMKVNHKIMMFLMKAKHLMEYHNKILMNSWKKMDTLLERSSIKIWLNIFSDQLILTITKYWPKKKLSIFWKSMIQSQLKNWDQFLSTYQPTLVDIISHTQDLIYMTITIHHMSLPIITMIILIILDMLIIDLITIEHLNWYYMSIN